MQQRCGGRETADATKSSPAGGGCPPPAEGYRVETAYQGPRKTLASAARRTLGSYPAVLDGNVPCPAGSSFANMCFVPRKGLRGISSNGRSSAAAASTRSLRRRAMGGLGLGDALALC